MAITIIKEWKLSQLLRETLAGIHSDDPQNRDLEQANKDETLEEFQTFTHFSEYVTNAFLPAHQKQILMVPLIQDGQLFARESTTGGEIKNG